MTGEPTSLGGRLWIFTLCIAGIIGLCGCSKDNRTPVFPVQGKVLYKGKPTANALVTFHPVNDNRRGAIHPVGHVDAQGNFTLTSFKKGDGAPEGEYRVTVVWYLASQARGKGEDTITYNYLPEKYGSVEKSQLRVNIGKGKNELGPFELK
jgi:hypothetical protein